MSRWMQILAMFGAVVIAVLAGWIGFSIGAYVGKSRTINDIRGEAGYIRDQARAGDIPAKTFCQSYRSLKGELSEVSLARAFQPLSDC